jgi:GNAT superfamily N-acetyltransferase
MEDDLAIGGAAVIVNPAGAFLFERRDTLAGLFDIRVRPEHRARGVGAQLLLHAAEWAKEQGCTQLRIECQNVNVMACRFYAKHCTLGGIERFGYAACPEVAHEAMLLWYRDLW